MLLRALIIFFFFVVNCYADFPPVHWTEFDTDPSVYPVNIIMPAGSLSTVSTGLVVTFTGGSGSESTTVSDTATIDLTLTGSDITGDVITLKDLVTTAPITGGTDNILVGADADITIALTQLKDIVTTAPLTGGENDVLPGADADLTLAITVAKDIVAGVGLSGGEDNVLPGADADTTLTFDATELDALTWDAGTLTKITWTWDTDTTDPTMTFENSGMIGIGTTNPTTALDVVGTINATALTEGGVAVYNDDEIDTYSELNTIVADVTLTHNGLIDTFAELDAIVADKALVNKADGAVWLGAHDFGGATSLEVTNTGADATLSVAGQIHFNTLDEQLSIHSAADGEISGEASISFIRHLTATFDPAGWYDQESTYRVVPLMYVGDDSPEGFTITEWKVNYVAGDPTTEIDMDLCCDTTPDFNPAAGMTVMDILDTTNGSSSADTGFDSATCANGARMYLRLGADPTDANVVVAVDVWGYNEED